MGGKNVLVFNMTERRISVADSDLVRVGYVQRKQTATGFFVDSSDIDRRLPLFSDAVRGLPGLRVSPGVNSRTNVITSASGGCVTTFVDGTAFKPMAPGDIDDYVSATQLIAIELYQPPNVPSQFVRRDEPGCAALLVWTQALRRRRRSVTSATTMRSGGMNRGGARPPVDPTRLAASLRPTFPWCG